MADRIILSEESVNSYGFRVLTRGIDLSGFKKNPVMLYDHRSYSYLPIGTWAKPRIESGQLSAEPIFDMEDEDAAKIAGKYDRKILNAASIGIDILATSDDPADMLPGQRLPTVTKCKLYEASIVPIPSNTNAVRLFRNGQPIDMSDENAVTLAFNINPNESEMEEKNLNPDKQGLLSQLNAKVDSLLAKLSGKKPEETAPPAPETPQESPEMVQLKADLNIRQTVINELRAENDQYKTQFADLKAEVTKLKASIAELANAPAETDTVPEAQEDSKAGEQNDVFAELNARAVSKFSLINKK